MDKHVQLVDYCSGRDLTRRWRVPALATAAMMLAALAPLGWFLFRTGRLEYVVSGELFTAEFDPRVVGTALDQPTIGKQFFLFTLFAAAALPYALVVRWLSDRRTRAGYWAFALPMIGLCACLLILLTIPFFWLLQYIHAMGFTPRRARGLAYGTAGYVAILAVLYRQLRAPRHDRGVEPRATAAT